MSDVIRRYPLLSYFVIAYAGSWVVWALFVLSLEGNGLLPFHAPASFMVLVGIGTFSGPTVSALVVTAATFNVNVTLIGPGVVSSPVNDA